MALDEVDSLMERLKKNDVVRIYTASNPVEPYLIPVTLLEDQSELFSTGILGSQDTFYFQDDDPEVWKTFLHWLVKHELREDIFEVAEYDQEQNLEHVVRCYVMAERHGMKAFQDEVMLFLLEGLAYGEFWPRELKKAALAAFQTGSPDSKVRRLLVEEAVQLSRSSEGDCPFGMQMSPGDAVDFEGLGFFQCYLHESKKEDWEWPNRFNAETCEPQYFWKTYMVGAAEKREAARYQRLNELE